MPHPGRISPEDIVDAARRLLEAGGPDAVGMRALARELGVAAPSLYFHIQGREAILERLIEAGFAAFAEAMQRSFALPGAVRERVHAMAGAYVAFAEANPQLFTLMFGPCDTAPTGLDINLASAEPVIALATEIIGPERGFWLAETLWAMVHGYTVLRLAGQFRLNPDHHAGFEFGLDLIVEAALAAREPAR